MKRAIAVLLAALCLLSLCACGKKTTEITLEPSPSDKAEAVVKDSPAVGEAPAAEAPAEPESATTFAPVISLSTQESRDMSNFVNGGLYYVSDRLYGRLFAVKGNYLRLSMIEIWDDGNYIQSQNAVRLDDDISPSYMTRDGDFLYYVRYHNISNEMSLARINIDGSGIELLYNGSDVDFLQIHNDRLYFTDENNHFVSSDKNGNDIQVIIDKEVYYPYFINEEWVMYQDDDDSESLHLFSVNTGYDIKLNNMRSYTPTIVGSTLYYLGVVDDSEHYHICRIDLSDMEFEIQEGVTDYVLDREVEIGEGEVRTLFTDGETLYGSNNFTAPLSDWRSFYDDGYSYLSERIRFLYDGWSVNFDLNSRGNVTTVFLRGFSNGNISLIPKVY